MDQELYCIQQTNDVTSVWQIVGSWWMDAAYVGGCHGCHLESMMWYQKSDAVN